jgi:PAS domain-containing protein
LEPVDLGVDVDDIVRQVFENDRRWVLCNDAMARLYDFPEELDFNSVPVDRVFSRSPENDVFVKQIIASGYCIDNALSIDFRHDGSSVYVENTVRADIEEDRLFRLWGTAKDVTIFHEEQNRLQRQILEMSSILAAIPGGILVIDRQRKLLALNPAVERLLGWKAEELLGKDIQKIIDIERPLPGGRRWYGCDWQRWSAEVLQSSGAFLLCDAQLAPVGDDSPAEKFVITLRQALVGTQKQTRRKGQTSE